jgi:hypothetical protein
MYQGSRLTDKLFNGIVDREVYDFLNVIKWLEGILI